LKDIDDDELFIDFKLNFEKENDMGLFNLLSQSNRFGVKKGR